MNVRIIVHDRDARTLLYDAAHDLDVEPQWHDVLRCVAIAGYRAPIVEQREIHAAGASVALTVTCATGRVEPVPPSVDEVPMSKRVGRSKP